ncbi:MAG: hypothetical protein ACFFDP_11355 [Promethearchaeota archaeon]
MQWLPFIFLYPALGILLVFLAILAGIWLIIHVEKSTQLDWPKVILAILIICLAAGFGFHLILLGLAV